MQFILWVASFITLIEATSRLETVYEWKYIDYLWESKEQKASAIKNGNYNFTKILTIDVDKAKDGRIFVTTIRGEGVPASLSTVSDVRGEGGPLLKPYPGWSWYSKTDCSGITNVYRVAIDDCNKMYVLDTGTIGLKYSCPAQILIFDLGTNNLLDRIEIPDNIAQNKTGAGLLITPIIHTYGSNCMLDSVYMADPVGRGLVVMNSQKRLFRLEARIFNPEETYSTISIAGESFFLDDGLFGIALTPSTRYHQLHEISRELYLRPLASRSLYAASTDVLERSTYGDSVKYKGNLNMMPSQASAMAFSSTGTLFFGLTREIAIGCWNHLRDMKSENIAIAAQDYERLQFTSGMKVLPKSRTYYGLEEIWVMTNRFQKIAKGTQNFSEVNFRVLKGSVDDLTRNTKCTPPSNGKRRPQAGYQWFYQH